MSNYQSEHIKVSHNKETSQTNQTQGKLLANTSFEVQVRNYSIKESQNQEVLLKVSQMVANLHSSLIPRTQNAQIYRQLSLEDQGILEKAKSSPLLHTISAGVMAIDSCMKHIYKQQSYWSSMVMKSLSVCLGNFQKLRENEPQMFNQGKMLKLQDSLQLIVSEIQKIPAARIKTTEIQRQKELINLINLKKQSDIALSKEQNLLFSLLANQNNSFRKKIQLLQKEIKEVSKQNELLRGYQSTVSLSDKKIKGLSDPYLYETSSNTSSKTIQDLNLKIKELKQQLNTNEEIIVKMNKEFSIQIQKYQKVFKQLQEQNRLLKQYNDVETAQILEQLEDELERMRKQKRRDQSIIHRVLNQFYQLSFYSKTQKTIPWSRQKKQVPPYIHRLSKQRIKHYQRSKSRSPSQLSTKKTREQLLSPNTQFSPYQKIYNMSKGQLYRQKYASQESNSPCFGSAKYDSQQTEKNIQLPKKQFKHQILSPRCRQFRHTRAQSTLLDTKRPNYERFQQENAVSNIMRKSKILKQNVFEQY